VYVLVSYDIVKNKTRSRVMKLLLNFGARIQLSVYECDLDETMYQRMKAGVEKLIDKEDDRVRYYRLCKGCVDRVVISGWGEVRQDEGFEVI
jgi:CRISPR-associated protein Cas2